MALIAPMTELEAVNAMLSAIGEEPVSTLAEDTIPDASIALDTLRQQSRQVQSRGWFFNKEEDYEFVPDDDGYINVPASILSIQLNPDYQYRYAVVRRGTKLYRTDERTYEFDAGATLRATIVRLLDFPDLPEEAKMYITARAQSVFQARMQGDQFAAEAADREVAIALVSLNRAENSNQQPGMYKNTDFLRLSGNRPRGRML